MKLNFKFPIPHAGDLLKRTAIFCHDTIMAGLSVYVALWLRLGDMSQSVAGDFVLYHAVAFMGIAGVVFMATGLYRGIWRYASIPDLAQVGKATTISVLVSVLVLFFVLRLDYLPRSFPVIQWLVLGLLLTVPRVGYRWWKDRELRLFTPVGGTGLPGVLLIGAGDNADGFIRATNRSPNPAYHVVGIVSQHQNRVGQQIQGISIVASYDTLESYLDSLPQNTIERVVLTRDDDATVIRNLVDVVTARGVSLSRLPRVDELNNGTSATQIQDIAVEDLLGRPTRTLNLDGLTDMVQGKRVLVTGAGGSIGSELVRQICDVSPAEIVLLDANEYQLYEIDREMGVSHPNITKHSVLANIRDNDRIDAVFAQYKPQLVFHAAALKHVPLVQDNMLEGIMTNVMGSRIIADACLRHQVACMVQISTDKAVNPTNVMGTTKRIAEQYIQALDPLARRDNLTRYVVVRFGNVLGSTGSVVPLFKKQLMAGGPITVTHADMERYFMTIAEAVQLVLQAGVIGHHNTSVDSGGRIFVLDMGDPVKIVDLARQMIRLSGQVPDTDIAITYTGLRPGEKLYEELLYADETLQDTPIDGIRLASPRATDYHALGAKLDALKNAVDGNNQAVALDILQELVPEFQGGDRGKKH